MNEIHLSPTDKYCVFQCCGETLAIPALCVRNVALRPKLSSIPITHRALAGLAYVHKEFLPVFDLSEFIGSCPENSTAGLQMLVLSGDQGAWSILIDQILGLESLEVSFNGPADETTDWAGVNIGSATFREHFVSIIEPDQLFSLINRHLRAHWQDVTETADFQTASMEPTIV